MQRVRRRPPGAATSGAAVSGIAMSGGTISGWPGSAIGRSTGAAGTAAVSASPAVKLGSAMAVSSVSPVWRGSRPFTVTGCGAVRRGRAGALPRAAARSRTPATAVGCCRFRSCDVLAM
jgi:hypothetical protein